MRMRPVHPFPARMAPDIAMRKCAQLPAGSIVLDPMCGSGTTLRTAIEHNLAAIGSDLDPLAVLVAKVNTTPLDSELAVQAALRVVEDANDLRLADTSLPWIDNDEETHDFIKFWFADKQIEELRKLVTVINHSYTGNLKSFLQIALSRLIITKEMGASLARDTSHSRPHRVALTNDYDVFTNFIKSAKLLAARLPEKGFKSAKVSKADARKLRYLKNASVDAVITSPPYLNAIDYMRGNKLSLVWLGYKLSDLRTIRGESIGAEKRPEIGWPEDIINDMTQAMDFYANMAHKEKNIFNRYIIDILGLMKEIERVLKPGGSAILVVGNSNLKGVFIKNTEAVKAAADVVGLKFVDEEERELPANKRYLPIFSAKHESSLAKRMRTEAILSFSK